jgi:hypothetical protein
MSVAFLSSAARAQTSHVGSVASGADFAGFRLAGVFAAAGFRAFSGF